MRGSGDTAVLIGLVSFSPDCNPRTASTYTNVAAGENYDFIQGSAAPPAAPIGGQDAGLSVDRGDRDPHLRRV